MNGKIHLPECLEANKKAPKLRPKKKEKQLFMLFVSLRLELNLKSMAPKSYF